MLWVSSTLGVPVGRRRGQPGRLSRGDVVPGTRYVAGYRAGSVSVSAPTRAVHRCHARVIDSGRLYWSEPVAHPAAVTGEGVDGDVALRVSRPMSTPPETGAVEHPASPSAPRWVRAVVLGLLCTQFVVLGVLQAWSDSLTFDEAPDLTVGLNALVHRDARMVPEHPPLPLLIAAIPALAAKPDVPTTSAWQANRYFDYSDELIAAQVDAGRLQRVLFLARLVPIALGVACGLLLHLLASRLTDPRGGLLVAGLWLTTPVVVGYAHLDGLDIPFTFTVLLVALAIEGHGRRPTVSRAAAIGAAVAAALLTRHTGLVLVPMVAGVTLWQARRADHSTQLRSLAAVLLVPVAAAWVVYRAIDPSGPPPEVARGFDARVESAAATSPVMGRLAASLPLPLEYRAGLAQLLLNNEEPHPAYLLGRSWEGGVPWYFPVSAAVKVPLSALAAMLAGAVAWRARTRLELARAATACLVPGAALSVVLLAQPLDLGLRYAFPVLALGLVLAAPLGSARGRGPSVLVALVVVGQLASVTAAHPHSIAWTSPLFRPAYQAVSDGNLDIGQGYREVAAWAKGKDVRSAMILPRGVRPIGRPLQPGERLEGDTWLVAGATALTVYRRDDLSWLRAYCPVRTLAGGSVLVYRFDQPPDQSPGPVRPAGLCGGRERSIRSG